MVSGGKTTQVLAPDTELVLRLFFLGLSIYLPAMQQTWVRSLGQEDPLEKGMATYSSILAWRIPMDRGAWPDTFSCIKELDTVE